MNNFLQLQMRTKKLACLWAGLLWITLLPLQAQEQDDVLVLDNLKQMSLRDLGQVEIRLDETFDIFDGLIQAKKTTVATGIKQYADRAPSVTTVITAQDIEAMGARTLEEALRSVPGLQVSYNWFNIPVYTLRGISSAFNPEVLVLVNGIRLNNSLYGAKGSYWNGFPISTISRLEIIRGPGSALYGADAFSGVINIITKNNQEIKGSEAGIRLGNFNTQDAWMTHGSQWNDFEITTMLDFSHTDGHQRVVESDAQTVFDQIFGTHASLAPGPYGSEITTYSARIEVAKQLWRLRAGIHKGDDMGDGSGIAQSLDPSKPMTEERINADLTYHDMKFTNNWEVQAQLSYLHTSLGTSFNLFPPGAFGGTYPIGYIGRASKAEDQTQLDLSGFYRGLEDHLIRIGIGYANYDMYEIHEVKNFGVNPFITDKQVSPTELLDVSDTSAAFIPEVSRTNGYFFLQDTWTINSTWDLTTGIRYDKYSDFGSTINPRLGLVWEATHNLTTKLLYGLAFRAPSFQELYNQNNPVAIGNINLKPEKIETWELAFDYRIMINLNLALNIFRYDIKDKVALVPRSNSEFGYANASSWKGQGFELESRWKSSAKSSVLFNYSYQNSKDEATNTTLSNAPQQFVFIRGDHLIGSYWYLDGQISWLDEWPRDVNDPRPAMDGYTTVDLTLRHKDIRGGKINFALGIKNLFDADVRYPSPGPGVGSTVVNVPNDLPGAGRFFFGELRYQF